MVTELESYREVYRRVNREEPPAPIVVGFIYCDEDPARAEEMARRHVGAYWESVMEHYEIRNDHFKGLKGYEYYNNMTEKVAQYGDDDVREFFLNLQVWGTPEQCLGKDRANPRTSRPRVLRRGVQLRRHALRRRRGQHAPIRREGDAQVEGNRAGAGRRLGQ